MTATPHFNQANRTRLTVVSDENTSALWGFVRYQMFVVIKEICFLHFSTEAFTSTRCELMVEEKPGVISLMGIAFADEMRPEPRKSSIGTM